MNCTDAENLFNQYLDEELGPGECSLLEEHLATCSNCTESLGQLRAIIEQADTMQAQISPKHNLWPGIRNRIEEGMLMSITYGTGWFKRSIRTPIAAAAAILIIAASVITVRSVGDRLEQIYTEWNVGLASLVAMEKQYAGATEDLVYSMGGYSDNLPLSVRNVIKEHLEIIEGAIADSRTALMENPSDTKLQSMLSATYRRKVELLQWTAQLSTPL